MADVKQIVGYAAVDQYVKSDMTVGLGTGTTAYHVVQRIGQKLKSGELTNITGVPTSESTRQLAADIGIKLAALDEVETIDVAIDGADEVDFDTMTLIKGRGGALWREKLVEQEAKQFVCVVDESKVTTGRFGCVGGRIPIEIGAFGSSHTVRRIKEKVTSVKDVTIRCVKEGGPPFVTDGGNYMADVMLSEPLRSKREIELFCTEIMGLVGVVEHGIFYDMRPTVLVANQLGAVNTHTSTV